MANGILRAGVAGAGVFGGYHAAKYAELPDVELTAIFDADGARAAARAKAHGAEGFTDFEAFLAQIDVLTVATPATTHADLALRALKAGKPVLVEKPVAMTLADADALIAEAASRDLVLQVGHQERYVAEALGLLDRQGVQALRSRRLNRLSGRAMDVSVVFDLMIHDLDLLAVLSGKDDAEVLSCTAKAEHGAAADHVEVRLRCGGVEGHLAASRLADAPTRDLAMMTGAGRIHLDFLTRDVANETPTPLAAALTGEDRPAALADPLGYGTASFVEAVRTRAKPLVTGEAGRAALRLALAVEAAVRDELS